MFRAYTNGNFRRVDRYKYRPLLIIFRLTGKDENYRKGDFPSNYGHIWIKRIFPRENTASKVDEIGVTKLVRK